MRTIGPRTLGPVRSRMRYLSLLAMCACLSWVGGTFIVSGPADAHGTGPMFTYTWNVSSQPNLSIVRGDMGVMTHSKIPNRIVNAADEWNAVANTHGGPQPVLVPATHSHPTQQQQISAPCNLPTTHQIWLFSGPGTIGTPQAEAVECVILGKIVLSNINFNGGENWGYDRWYTNGDVHFLSALTHEIGHALGFAGHWPVPSSKCASIPSTNSSDQTMCEGELPIDKLHPATLGTNDEHHYDAAYQ